MNIKYWFVYAVVVGFLAGIVDLWFAVVGLPLAALIYLVDYCWREGNKPFPDTDSRYEV